MITQEMEDIRKDLNKWLEMRESERRNRMTNLEANKDKLRIQNTLCVNAHICKYGESCEGKKCFGCEFYNDVNACIKAMLSEHKKPIKLKQWERDLLDCYHSNFMFGSYDALVRMKQKGCFKGITNTSMTLKEILDNCDVIDK